MIKKGNELGFVDEKLNTFDLAKLGKAIIPQRDQNFTYLGLQTLYDRYFITSEETRYELMRSRRTKGQLSFTRSSPVLII
jgi:ribonucleoside-diphosphate reductase alpha chain